MNEHWEKIRDEKLVQKIREGARKLNRADQIKLLVYLKCLLVLDRVEFHLSRFWGTGWIVGRPLSSEHREILRPIYSFLGWFFKFIV
jgi:hypothetical protein